MNVAQAQLARRLLSNWLFGERSPVLRDKIIEAINYGFMREELPGNYLQDWIGRQVSTGDFLEKVSDLIECEIGKPSVSGGHTDDDRGCQGSEGGIS